MTEHHHHKHQGPADAADPGKGNQDTAGQTTTASTSTNPPPDQVGDQPRPPEDEQAAPATSDNYESGSGDTDRPADQSSAG
jgi:hypothetical protein